MDAFDLPALEGPAAGAMSVAEALAPRPVPVMDLQAEVDAARERGYEAGLAEGQAQLESAVAALQAAAAALDARCEALAAEAERGTVELGLKIAEQALGAALAVDPERIVAVVRGALRRLVERERVTVLVHPDDLDLVRGAVPGLVSQLGGIEHLEVQAERRVARGGAVVATGEGEVDATLATKLERAREVLEEALGER
jgi:flagellar assembly protein FliH